MIATPAQLSTKYIQTLEVGFIYGDVSLDKSQFLIDLSVQLQPVYIFILYIRYCNLIRS